MNRREFALAAAALPGLLALPARAQSDQGDKSYITLKQPAPVDAPAGKIEVIEFFSYACSHCRDFEPAFSAWKKNVPGDVALHLVHVGFSSAFEPLQRIYYTLETLGKAEALHGKVYDAFQVEHKRLEKPDVLFAWAAEQGLERAKFEEVYKSFGVASKLRRAVQLQQAYGVEGTPSMGIAGRWYTDGGLADSNERMLLVANTLIARARKG